LNLAVAELCYAARELPARVGGPVGPHLGPAEPWPRCQCPVPHQVHVLPQNCAMYVVAAGEGAQDQHA